MADGGQFETKSWWWVLALPRMSVRLLGRLSALPDQVSETNGTFLSYCTHTPSGGVESPFWGLGTLVFDHN